MRGASDTLTQLTANVTRVPHEADVGSDCVKKSTRAFAVHHAKIAPYGKSQAVLGMRYRRRDERVDRAPAVNIIANLFESTNE